MRDMFGKYHEDRIIFLMDFLDLIHLKITDPYLLFTVKKNANLWNMPNRLNLLTSKIWLKINQF